jgi:cellulose synthase/poly-beta-1,6-N-acetylglucosamine synthase-like glycosyltransferase
MGRIVYAPRAHTFTQDPPSISAYIKQITRWYSGFFQVIKKHRVGTKLRAIDMLIAFLAIDGFFYPINLVILGVFSILKLQRLDLELVFATDFSVLLTLVSYAAWRNRRWDILTPLPYYYIIRLINLAVFFWAPIKVFVFSRQPGSYKWNTPHFAHSKMALASMKGGV